MRRYIIVAVLAACAALAVVIALPRRPPAPAARSVSATAAPAATQGALVWRNGGMALRLTDEPCSFEEQRDQLELEGVPPAKRYVVTQGERKRSGCFVRDIGGDVLTLEPGGKELGTIPADWFKREPGV